MDPQPNTNIDSLAPPLDSLIQHPMIPTLPQPFPQPETKEPTSNEIAPDDPNQEYLATETHESKPHSLPLTEPPTEPPPHEIATSTSPLMTESLLPQSETPMTLLDSVTRGFNPHAAPTTSTPDNLNQERMATVTHGFIPHSMPATEPLSEPPLHEITSSTPPLMSEPLSPQLEIPMTPQTTPPDQTQSIDRPTNWNQKQTGAQRRLRQIQKHKK